MPRPVILCYHAVSSTWTNESAVSEGLMERHLSMLRRRGYVGFTLAELASRRRSGTLPDRAVAITFDDGYASTLRAKPILDAVGYPATVYVVTSFVDSGALLFWPGVDRWHDGPQARELRPLSWDEIDELAAAGWEIGSHTDTHPCLPTLSDDELECEVVVSREAIARHVGRCETLAYPFGATDDRVAEAAERAGYRAACTVGLAPLGPDDYRLSRVGVYGRDADVRMRAKLSPLGRALARGLTRMPRRRAGGARRPVDPPARGSS